MLIDSGLVDNIGLSHFKGFRPFNVSVIHFVFSFLVKLELK